MKSKILLLYFSAMLWGYHGFAQITMSKKRMSYVHFFKEISKQTGYRFIYNNNMLPKGENLDVEVNNLSIKDVLSEYLKPANLSYEFRDDHLIVIKKSSKPVEASPLQQSITVKGRIFNSDGEALPGATIMIKGTPKGTTTDAQGNFQLNVPNNEVTLVISYIGHQPLELKPWKGNKMIELKASTVDINTVTITTGMFNRNKVTFSGAVASFTGKELKTIGNLNVLQSLKTLDPSFVISPNNLQGANPNQLPNIEVRGKTSLTSNTVRDQYSTDPNQPLFILNGMETTLQQIVDLDINRVASITLLKDAASTALYGSRAANGVVIVETIRPKPGELTVSYTADLRYEVPDLRDYNMMNAAENLEFQRLAGFYQPDYYPNSTFNDNLYNNRLIAVTSGVNSYWLNVPLKNSFTNGHSLRVSGGSEEFQYGVALNYRKLNGVMKGSDRATWGGTVDLTYRKNKLNIFNSLYINGTNSNESPYGNFEDYVKINPYYSKKRADGSVNTDRYLEIFTRDLGTSGFYLDSFKVGNPLYNALLPSKNNSNNITIQNNLNLIYDISSSLRLSGAFQVNKTSGTNIIFKPANHTDYDNTDVYQKGLYSESRQDKLNYQGNLMLTYLKVIQENHSLNANIRTEIQEENKTLSSYSATGIPVGVSPNPAFAYSYLPNSKPGYKKIKTRKINALASFNYSYKNRYFVDFNYRIDGSTVFGSANKYSPFWSIGGGWNISAEKGMETVYWLDILRIRANIGTTGNQALGTYASTAVYKYTNDLNYFGQGLIIDQLGNPNLEWQRTRSISAGIDVALWQNRLTATLNIYQKRSSPLITTGSLPGSSGVETYALNVGELNTKGAESIIKYSPIYKLNKNVIWTLGYTGSFYKSKYKGFSNILKNLNDEAQKSNSLERYLDGYSPDELWAVPSLGIDPATGKEVFKKKNGEYTYIYDPSDIAPIGEKRPVIEGVVSSNLNIKGFLLGINLRYSFGKYVLNKALYDKVENIGYQDLNNNQDKRALELRWKHPGDHAQFKSIDISEETPISSRFIQKENYLGGESINLGYEFRAQQYVWIRKLKINSIRLNAYTNDIFRLSNIQSERGIQYPFSNTMALSLNIFF
ncbi:SusC/RagA family TonB-linked outer membrane protein [Chitinophaga caeni]|uniref:SusC/RagA family TonB-linked outer membrane protein n=1 Tax=Chitinophaga caeni TaxID=2029983 RepID=A0A291QYY0_9BACT|nr:SusC/RagA family TonB-linked outer membrane protein [Chitinophaga caeni]ATL49092.1 SusC/RagA family TonB-linked outer membrane protein [Chitinophaga caeni]